MLRFLAPAYPGHGNYSLCHGSSGNSDLLILADDLVPGSGDRPLAESVGRQGIEVFEQTGSPWPCGVQDAGETPNLLLGLAGIGYFYLRLHDSRRVPSVLVLMP